MKRSRYSIVGAVVCMVMLGAGSRPAWADLTTFYCPDRSTCNGNSYAVGVVSQTGSSTYVLEVDIKVTSNYTGTLGTDVIDALAIKNFADSFTNPLLVAAPGGTSNWNLNRLELNSKGCEAAKDNDNHGLCVQAKSEAAAPKVTSDSVLVWQFQFDSTGPLRSTAHLKYLYEKYEVKVVQKGKKPITTETWSKVGDLGSWDIPIQRLAVPEASSMVLLLSMLGAVAGCSLWAKGR